MGNLTPEQKAAEEQKAAKLQEERDEKEAADKKAAEDAKNKSGEYIIISAISVKAKNYLKGHVVNLTSDLAVNFGKYIATASSDDIKKAKKANLYFTVK